MSETGDFQNTSSFEKESDYCSPAALTASGAPAATGQGQIEEISTSQAKMAHLQHKQGQGSSLRIILEELKDYRFYHGEMNRNQSESLLEDKPGGSFLIRYSKRPKTYGPDGYLINNDKLVLSLKQKEKKIKHIVINKAEAQNNTYEVREVSFFTRMGGPSICDELSPIFSGPPL